MKKLQLIALMFVAMSTVLVANADKPKDKDQEAVAVLYKTDGSGKAGTVLFKEVGKKVQVKVMVSGLKPNSVHGFHVHQYGDLQSKDGSSAGGHFNPDGHQHAGPHDKMRHAGDMGNLTANAKGVVNTTLTFENFTLDPKSKEGIVGRSVVLHAGTDDLKSQPSGDAGARWAVGVVGWAQPASEKKK